MWILCWGMLASCTKEPTQSYTIPLPEVESLAELELLQNTLLAEQNALPEGIRFYEAVDIEMIPSPVLHVTVYARHLRKQNLMHRLHEWGYSVEGRPGDPSKRAVFLVEGL